MNDVNCPACGLLYTAPDDPELEETRAELRRLQVHGSAPPGFALVSREMLRAMVNEIGFEGLGADNEIDEIIDKALGEAAFAS